MKILAIETSCDETGIAIIEAAENKTPKTLINLVRSQIELHKPYGGVFPSLAKREHIKVLPEILNILENKKLLENIDLVAVTQGPGLSPCLWAGISFAKDLAEKLDIPLVGVNHLKGHIYIVFPEQDIEYPLLSLIVSGGHTELVFSSELGKYEILGRTRDDAAGEAFDKVARLLGLSYPGGPEISRVAEDGDAKAFDFPRPMIGSKDFDFSFAGLKTAVMYLVKGLGKKQAVKLTKKNIANIAASFQQAAVDVLVEKTIRAAKKFNPKTIILGGGVAANKFLREELERRVNKSLSGIRLILPDPKLTTDNALMIALAAWYERKDLIRQSADKKKLEALANLRIDEK